MFDLMTSTGVFFAYEVFIPDRSKMQIVEFTVTSPFTADASVVTMNVASLAVLGKSVEQTLVEHVEHYERIAVRRASEEK